MDKLQGYEDSEGSPTQPAGTDALRDEWAQFEKLIGESNKVEPCGVEAPKPVSAPVKPVEVPSRSQKSSTSSRSSEDLEEQPMEQSDDSDSESSSNEESSSASSENESEPVKSVGDKKSKSRSTSVDSDKVDKGSVRSDKGSVKSDKGSVKSDKGSVKSDKKESSVKGRRSETPGKDRRRDRHSRDGNRSRDRHHRRHHYSPRHRRPSTSDRKRRRSRSHDRHRPNRDRSRSPRQRSQRRGDYRRRNNSNQRRRNDRNDRRPMDQRRRGGANRGSRSPSPKRWEKSPEKQLNFKEKLKQQLMEVQKSIGTGLDPEQLRAMLMRAATSSQDSKPSNLPLQSDNPLLAMALNSEGKVTPQQAVLQQMAAMHQKAQELTGVAVPKYYNPAAVNPLKYAEQFQKRKLLWSKAKDPPKEAEVADETTPASSSITNKKIWQSLSFGQEKTDEKFRKLMGIKEGESMEPSELTEEQLRKQQELFENLDKEYAFARMTTHTHRGMGLGIISSSYAAMAVPSTTAVTMSQSASVTGTAGGSHKPKQ